MPHNAIIECPQPNGKTLTLTIDQNHRNCHVLMQQAADAGSAYWIAALAHLKAVEVAKAAGAELPTFKPPKKPVRIGNHACVHLGDKTGEQIVCKTCRGGKGDRMDVFHCVVHGECSINRDVGKKVCGDCHQYVPWIALPVDQ